MGKNPASKMTNIGEGYHALSVTMFGPPGGGGVPHDSEVYATSHDSSPPPPPKKKIITPGDSYLTRDHIPNLPLDLACALFAGIPERPCGPGGGLERKRERYKLLNIENKRKDQYNCFFFFFFTNSLLFTTEKMSKQLCSDITMSATVGKAENYRTDEWKDVCP